MVADPRVVAIAIGLVLAGLPIAQAQQPEAPGPRYLSAIQTELRAIGATAVCETDSPIVGRCELRHVTADARTELLLKIVYSDESDTIYIYLPQLATAHPEDETTMRVLRRIAELNWRLLGTKIEWNPSTGEVRLSALLHTDSNFDRRAFRTLLRAVLTHGERYQPELRRLSTTAL